MTTVAPWAISTGETGGWTWRRDDRRARLRRALWCRWRHRWPVPWEGARAGRTFCWACAVKGGLK